MSTYTFFVPSFASQTDQARTQAWREFEKIMREGVLWFGAEEVGRLLKEIAKSSTRAAFINKCMLVDYHAAVREAAPKRVNKAKLARDSCKKYRLHNPDAVLKRLNRLLLEERRKAGPKRRP